MKPDPTFVKFFDGKWQRRLDACRIPGMDKASWDRKAAYLLWLAEGKPDDADDEDDWRALV